MGRQNPKRDKQIENAQKLAAEGSRPFLDPFILFGRASNDDLAHYTPQMLVASAVHAAQCLKSWTRVRPSVTLQPVEGVQPGDIAVHVLTVIDRNMPFLFDSVMGEVTATHRELHLAVHPILLLAPGEEPVLRSGDNPGDPAHHVSLIQIHLPPLSAMEADTLVARIQYVLEQVHLAITDWRPMLDLLQGAAEQLRSYSASRRKSDRDEALAFLDWLRDDNFTFLGMREYVYSGKGPDAKVERSKGRGLGILSDPDVLVLRQGKDAVTTTPEILEFLDGPDFLIVTKANVKSVVHRRAYMDYVGIKRFDSDGRVTGELRVVGLFTATAYTHSVRDIPLLRAKAQRVEEKLDFDPNSHSGRMLANTLESYPRDDLFQIDVPTLGRFCEQIMELSERPRVRALPRIDHFDRFVSIIVYVPREDYNSHVREKVSDYLAKVYDGHLSAYYPAFPEGGVARVHIIIGRRGSRTPRIPQAALEEAIRAISTPWSQRFAALSAGSAKLAVNNAFQEAFTPEEAYADLEDIVACAAGEPIRISFYTRPRDEEGTLRLKIFHQPEHLSLSRRVPLLENLGFRIVSEQTFDIDVQADAATRPVALHDMELQLRHGAFVLERDAARLEEAFLAAFRGLSDNDSFNRLVLLSGLTTRETTVLRAYARYLRQAGIVYSQPLIAETLARYPGISHTLFQLFHGRFDPRLGDTARTKALASRHAELEEALSGVPSLDDDRIFRRYINAIDATLRTNYFRHDEAGLPPATLAFKFDPKLLDGLPQPRPFREVFVYGTDVEGVHLRFGKVARGGLRWSDRAEDYRTEVLGLVKAQQVKNSVIVPVGAKGGFVPKALPSAGSREEIFTAGRQAYKTFIRTLLSITDNIVGDQVVGPENTVRVDGDDPYFVVAADKGTATFSDTANDLAQEAGFWLDDAFASGGSAGYDHKKMGITARGAWEAVKRHFREMDIDIQTTPFTVAGVGDMSGDVFGNGMLLSPHIRLVAAFDHRDIFIDPAPETSRSFAERQRLFALPRSSWQDYDRTCLSEGGMIISRSEKSVKLTPQAMAAIDIGKDVATPFEIMTAILRSPVDLLWFGGIGTYIKAASETDAEVGDRANDPIRVVGTEVRAKVIGEGANLGVTQKGRIAYALNGGRLNSDAIDNSAGVNSSDVEVNIKIAFSSAMRSGRLTREKRNQLLASMTDEVAALVLRNNYLQTLAISLTARQGADNRESLSRLMSVLESQGHLNRSVETLPAELELSERYQTGKPLTRPEIGVLLSYAKITLFDEILEGDLPDEPYLADILKGYFPAKMQKAFAADIESHRLHREIVATVLANEVINRGGPGFIQAMIDATGASPTDVVKAAYLARDGFELPRLWAATDALDGQISGEVQNDLYARIGEIFKDATHLILTTDAGTGSMETAIAALRAGAKKLKGNLDSLGLASKAGERAAELEAKGVPADIAANISRLPTLALVPELLLIGNRTGSDIGHVAQTYFAVTETFRIDRLLALGEAMRPTDHYESIALGRSLAQISAARRDIVCSALTAHPAERKPLAVWYGGKQRPQMDRVATELVLLSDSPDFNLAKLSVAAGLLGDLTELRPQASSA
ncbi:NAD-glutamate dehydrogenase [Pseudorhizobium endolithicum]|uniref:NAD-glutamate dehydrogenase n=1 Tax=Pseudorhizobium endolithicum TaxID=1191678 RepID=A0ABN7JUL4_9HYPH|nr:NAD-glutamate dehydrogenase [Pseudorhizobium endolithicum]CAD7048995.1 NAD-glutamate dehydrogenase [Pseudorhizobium endolithicum]